MPITPQKETIKGEIVCPVVFKFDSQFIVAYFIIMNSIGRIERSPCAVQEHHLSIKRKVMTTFYICINILYLYWVSPHFRNISYFMVRNIPLVYSL